MVTKPSYEELELKIEELKRKIIERQVHDDPVIEKLFARYSSIFDSVPTSIVLVDKKGQIIDINPYHVSHIGNGKTLKKDYLDYNILEYPSVIAAGLQDEHQKVLNGESIHLKSVRYPETTGGRERIFNIKGVPLFKNNKVTGAVIIHEDITDLKDTEKALKKAHAQLELNVEQRTSELKKAYKNLILETGERKQAENALRKMENNLYQTQKMESIGTLAGGIAHDFNNILFPIIGHTEMLLEDVAEDSPLKESLSEIHIGALRARDLVKQILTFSRQENSALKLMKMQPVIKEALKFIRSAIPATIEIKQDIKTDCGVILADPTQIHQIIMNLTTNAYHAMEKTGGKLKVSLKKIKLDEHGLITPDMIPGDYACLSVSDTGSGMNKDLKKNIFYPFFTTKKQGKGTGMGLSVVHGIVKGSGGAIRVDSEPGKGSEFKIYFPIKSSLEKQDIQTKESISYGTETVLLVDDEEVIMTTEEQMLKRLGYKVSSHTSSIKALETFRTNPDKFDIVITDMAMPDMSGDKLSIELMEIRPDIPILLCTGFSMVMSEEKAASMGIKGFILKPIVIQNLAKKIREILDKK
jgi:PAS domain S-box-containing protein